MASEPGNNHLVSIALRIGAAGQIAASGASIRKFALCTSLCFLVGTAGGLCFIPFVPKNLMFVPALAGAEIALLTTFSLVRTGKFGPFVKHTAHAYIKSIACYQLRGALGLGCAGASVGGADADFVPWMCLDPGWNLLSSLG